MPLKEKTVQLSGVVKIEVVENELRITATEGSCFVATGGGDGSVVYMYHPLSGWYIEQDLRMEAGYDTQGDAQ